MPLPENIDLSSIIRHRREALGATVAKAAHWANLSADRWAAIEAGRPFDVAELRSISYGLAADPGALLKGKLENPRRSTARFRSISPPELSPEDLRTLSLAAELGRIGGAWLEPLEREFDFERLREPTPVTDFEEPWRQGYRLGEQARRRCRLAPGPISDLERALAGLGIHVARVRFTDPQIEAASLWEKGALPIVLLNAAAARIVAPLSRRAAMAHELCHLLHDTGEHDLATAISRTEGHGESAIEQRARAFAPAFLAPRDEVRLYFRSGEGRRHRPADSKVLAIAKRWGLSLSGAAWHAGNCGLIDASTAERLANESTAMQDWSRDFEASAASDVGEGTATAQLTAGLLRDSIEDASAAGLISEARGREILSWGR